MITKVTLYKLNKQNLEYLWDVLTVGGVGG